MLLTRLAVFLLAACFVLADSFEECSPGVVAVSVLVPIAIMALIFFVIFFALYKTGRLICRKQEKPLTGDEADDAVIKSANVSHTNHAFQGDDVESGFGRGSIIEENGHGPRKQNRESQSYETIRMVGRDNYGLGFTVSGNKKDGIFVESVNKSGPAMESNRFQKGDTVKSLKIYFENMVLEDALTFLTYAGKYCVDIELYKTSVSSDTVKTDNIPTSDIREILIDEKIQHSLLQQAEIKPNEPLVTPVLLETENVNNDSERYPDIIEEKQTDSNASPVPDEPSDKNDDSILTCVSVLDSKNVSIDETKAEVSQDHETVEENVELRNSDVSLGSPRRISFEANQEFERLLERTKSDCDNTFMEDNKNSKQFDTYQENTNIAQLDILTDNNSDVVESEDLITLSQFLQELTTETHEHESKPQLLHNTENALNAENIAHEKTSNADLSFSSRDCSDDEIIEYNTKANAETSQIETIEDVDILQDDLLLDEYSQKLEKSHEDETNTTFVSQLREELDKEIQDRQVETFKTENNNDVIIEYDSDTKLDINKNRQSTLTKMDQINHENTEISLESDNQHINDDLKLDDDTIKPIFSQADIELNDSSDDDTRPGKSDFNHDATVNFFDLSADSADTTKWIEDSREDLTESENSCSEDQSGHLINVIITDNHPFEDRDITDDESSTHSTIGDETSPIHSVIVDFANHASDAEDNHVNVTREEDDDNICDAYESSEYGISNQECNDEDNIQQLLTQNDVPIWEDGDAVQSDNDSDIVDDKPRRRDSNSSIPVWDTDEPILIRSRTSSSSSANSDKQIHSTFSKGVDNLNELSNISLSNLGNG